MTRMSLGRCLLCLLAGVATAFGLLIVAEAGADDAVITTPPVLSGVPQVQQTLTATASYTAPAGSVVTWSWERCTGAGFTTCAPITGTGGGNQPDQPERQLSSADRDTQLRARITITLAGVATTAVSPNTPTIVGRNQPAPPPIAPPVATPTPTPAPTTTPDPAPTTTAASSGSRFEVAAPPAPAASSVQSTRRPAMLRPFPVVRVKGVLTTTGARITELAVTAPRSASITVLCSGSSCPRAVQRREAARTAVRLRTFERALRSGTRISIRVARKGFVGKRTLIRIQRGAAPKRSDLCLSSRGRTIVCPAA